MDTHLPFLLGLLLTLHDTPGGVGTRVFYVKEGEAAFLPCEAGGRNDVAEQWWVRGFTNSTATSSTEEQLFHQIPAGAVDRLAAARDDMIADPADFKLTLTSAMLEDKSVFTCRVMTSSGYYTYSHVNITVYVLPELIMMLDKPAYTEGESLTVTCSIPRVTPQLLQEDFALTWGHRVTSSVSSSRSDGSYSYTLTHTRQVTTEDNSKIITCTVTPRIGSEISTTRTINVTSALPRVEGGATISQDPPTVKLGQRVVLSCTLSHTLDAASSTYTWYRNQELLTTSSSSTHHLTQVTPSNQGNYTCHVTDGTTIVTSANHVTLAATPHKEYIVNAGDSVTLTCDYSGGGDIYELSWIQGFSHYGQRAGTQHLYDLTDNDYDYVFEIEKVVPRQDLSIDPDTYALTLGRVTRSDCGLFTCRYLNDIDNMFQYHQVHVRTPPKLEMSLSTGVAVEGEDVEVTCDVPAVNPALPDKSFYLQWGHLLYHAPPPVSSSCNHSYHLQKVVKVTRGHAGYIRCKVHKEQEVLEETRYLTVQYPPTGRPTLHISPRSVHPGDTVRMTCDTGPVARGEPPELHARWYRGGELLGQGFGDQLNVSVTVVENHGGQYTCSVGSVVGFTPVSDIVDLHVQPKVQPTPPSGLPTVTVDKQDVLLGQEVTFTCDVTMVRPGLPPELQVKWYQDSQELSDQETDHYTLTVTAEGDVAGRYSCSVGNSEGFTDLAAPASFNIKVPAPPSGKPTLSLRPLTPDNASWELVCDVSTVQTGYPPEQEVEWYQDGVVLQGETGGAVTLASTENHQREYYCIVRNTEGASSRSDSVPLPRRQAEGVPEIQVLPSRVQEGQQVHLSCHLVGGGQPGDPVTWYRQEEVLEELGQEPNVTIKARSGDAGNYSCEVGGRRSSSVTLTVLHQLPGPSADPVTSVTPDIRTLAAGVGGAAILILVITLIVMLTLCCRRNRKKDTTYENPRALDTLPPTMRAPAPPPTSYSNPAYKVDEIGQTQATGNPYEYAKNLGEHPAGHYVNTSPRGAEATPEDELYWVIRDEDKPRDLRLGDKGTYYNNSQYSQYANSNASSYTA